MTKKMLPILTHSAGAFIAVKTSRMARWSTVFVCHRGVNVGIEEEYGGGRWTTRRMHRRQAGADAGLVRLQEACECRSEMWERRMVMRTWKTFISQLEEAVGHPAAVENFGVKDRAALVSLRRAII